MPQRDYLIENYLFNPLAEMSSGEERRRAKMYSGITKENL